MFADTKAYADLGETIFKFFGPIADSVQLTVDLTPVIKDPESVQHARASAGARSPYFAFYFTLLAKTGSIWLVAIVQSLLGAYLIELGLRLAGASSLRVLTGFVALAALSSVSFYTSLMMPDAFASFGLLAAGLLICFWNRIALAERYALGGIITLSVLFHSTHAPIILASVLSVGVLIRVWSHITGVVRPLILVAILCIAGPVGAIVYNHMASRAIGGDIYRPPFLTARLLEDGPGRRMLEEKCEKDPQRFALCRYRSRDLTNSQAFLWERGTDRSIFADADPSTRIEMAKEDVPFALETIRHDFFGVVRSALWNFANLLPQHRLDDIADRSAVYRDALFKKLSVYDPRGRECEANANVCAASLPVNAIGLVAALVSLAGFLLIASDIASRFGRWTRVDYFVVSLCAGTLVNDLLCAAFSGPYARYHTRVSWLLLFGALVLLARRSRSSRKEFV